MKENLGSGDFQDLLGELLAVIHRDGGHYVAWNGYKKGVEEAIRLWYELIQIKDTYDEWYKP